jgi:cytochrome c-type biogenesis protein CcmH/NrfG
MGWLFLFLLAAVTLGLLWRFAGLKGSALELLTAALLFGIAGYAWQGTPDLPGQPTPPRTEAKQADSLFALERKDFLERFTGDAQILDAADAMHRNGMEAYGIALIRGALEKHPDSPDLWLGMGNALTLYANGLVTPAAELAFNRAAKLSPDHPGPAYFLGLAFAQSGQLDRARTVWTDLLDRAPADAPWRARVEQRLAQIEQR